MRTVAFTTDAKTSTVCHQMNAFIRRWEPYARYVIFAVRIAAALLFFQHGAEKLFGFTGARQVPSLFIQRGVAGLSKRSGRRSSPSACFRASLPSSFAAELPSRL